MRASKSISRDHMTRRALLGAGTAAAMIATVGTGLAQQPAPPPPAPRVKGPRVWLDMDQIELDAAYDQSVYAPNLQQVVKRWATNSEGVRTRLGAPQRYVYGPSSIEGLDVYRTKRPNAPINIFIHGGEWRLGAAKSSAFPAELFVHAGAHYVVPDFAWVQDVGGSLMPIAEQVRRAVAWVHRNAKSFGGDSDRIYISGHSSGGHLAGVIMTTDWPKDFNLPIDTVKGALCCSGIFDLKPVRLSARRKYINFTDEMEHALSSQRHLDKLNAPVIVAHGTLESPESNASRATSPPRRAPRGSRYSFSWPRATTISRSSRRSAIPTALWVGRCWSRCSSRRRDVRGIGGSSCRMATPPAPARIPARGRRSGPMAHRQAGRPDNPRPCPEALRRVPRARLLPKGGCPQGLLPPSQGRTRSSRWESMDRTTHGGQKRHFIASIFITQHKTNMFSRLRKGS